MVVGQAVLLGWAVAGQPLLVVCQNIDRLPLHARFVKTMRVQRWHKGTPFAAVATFQLPVYTCYTCCIYLLYLLIYLLLVFAACHT